MLPERLEARSVKGCSAVKRVDRPSKENPRDSPSAIMGLCLKRPDAVFNKAGLSDRMPSSSSSSSACRAEQALPPDLLNLIELSSLESSGVKVDWPEGINTQLAHTLIFEFFSPMIEREEVNEEIAAMGAHVYPSGNIGSKSPDTAALSSPFRENLEELLSLSDAGESVTWPEGFYCFTCTSSSCYVT